MITPDLVNATRMEGIVVYAEAGRDGSIPGIPVLRHFAGNISENISKPERPSIDFYYPKPSSHLFATPFQDQFDYNTEAVSHTRSLTFLKKLMNGPYFDLESIWDEHTYYEFADRSVEHTMSTMVAEPYVNHVPTVRFFFSSMQT